MADNRRPEFIVTARQAQHEEYRFEYVVSRPGFEAGRSTTTFPSYAAARAAGIAHAHELAGQAAETPTPRP